MNSVNIFSKETNSKGTKGYNKHAENSIFNNFNETQYFQEDDQDCITRGKDKDITLNDIGADNNNLDHGSINTSKPKKGCIETIEEENKKLQLI